MRAPINRAESDNDMSQKDDYFAMMVSRLKRWDAEFGMLGEDGGQGSEAANAQLEAQLKALHASRNAVYKQLQEIRTANESGWRRLQAAVDAAWTPMRRALDEAAASRSKMRARAP